MAQQPPIGADVTDLMIGEDVTDLIVGKPTREEKTSQREVIHPRLAGTSGTPFRGDTFSRSSYPALGGAIGSIGGIPGAAIGGAGGAALRDIEAASLGAEDAPSSGPESMLNVWQNAGGQAALSRVGQLAGEGVRMIGNQITQRAVPMVRSALKPVWAEVRRRANVEGSAPAAVANSMARFIVERQLRTPEQAQALIRQLGGQIDEALQGVNTPVDTATRVPRYLDRLMRRASGQALPQADQQAVRATGQQVLENSPLSRSVTTQVEREAPTAILDQSGRPMTRRVVEDLTHREMRTDLTPSEAMQIARDTSRMSTGRTWGSDPGNVGAREAERTVERAVRDAAKAAVPAVRPMLSEQGRALDARRLLDRASWRDANRDAVGLGGIMGVASGRPLLGMLLQAAKEGQLRMGLRAGQLGPRIARTGDAAGVSTEQLLRALQTLLTAEPQTPTEPPE